MAPTLGPPIKGTAAEDAQQVQEPYVLGARGRIITARTSIGHRQPSALSPVDNRQSMLRRGLIARSASALRVGTANRSAVPSALRQRALPACLLGGCKQLHAGGDEPRSVTKPDGRVIALAPLSGMRKAFGKGARVMDVRDPSEVEAQKGGRAAKGAKYVPINVGGVPQAEHSTTVEEFSAALLAAGISSKPRVFVVHCTGGGRAEKAVELLTALGHTVMPHPLQFVSWERSDASRKLDPT